MNKRFRSPLSLLATLGLLSLLSLSCSDTPGSPSDPSAKTVTTVPPPTVVILGTTDTSITVQFTAPSVGAPAGFVLQWAPSVALNGAGGWENYAACAAIFGQDGPFGTSAFSLGPNQSVTIVIGTWLTSQGISGLIDPDCSYFFCSQEWSVRGYVVPFGLCDKADNSQTVIATTPDCGGESSCTYSQGYWKNHQSEWPAPYVPANPFYGSGKTWSQTLADPGNGDKQLRVQFIAATLNKGNGIGVTQSVSVSGVGTKTIAQILTESDAYFTALPSVTLTANQITQYAAVLEAWNTNSFYPNAQSGVRLGPGHCGDDDGTGDGGDGGDGGGGNGGDGCTWSQGYWKNHTPWPAPHAPSDLWFNIPTETWASAITGLNLPNNRNSEVNLAKQYVAAMLNKANGASTSATTVIDGNSMSIQQILDASTAFFNGQTPSVANTTLDKWKTALDNFNLGYIGPGHCD